MRVCKQCGISIEGKISSAVYCSKSCYNKARYEANKMPKVTENCKQCGDSIEGKRSDAVYCSVSCRDKARREAKKMPKVTENCKQCGVSMEGKRSHAVYCSASCSQKARYEANPEKRKEYKKAWHEANPEKQKEYKKAYREANRDKVLAGKKSWYEANKDKEKERVKAYREANRDKVLAGKKAYREANPEKVRANSQRRRARKRALPAEFTKEQWRNALNYFDHKCAYCDKPLKRAHQEHFIPLSNGGAYTKDNIVPSCPKCNLSKGDKNPAKWLFESREFIEAAVRYTKITRYLRGL